VYTGASVANLTAVSCRFFGDDRQVFRAQAGTTYYFQLSAFCCNGFGSVTFRLAVAPNPQASFFVFPDEPSAFDTVGFSDNSFDPAGGQIVSEAWTLGDGATATGCCPTHHYAQDGDYTVGLTVTTADGRTASTSRVLQVRTHDVAIVGIAVPNSA